MADGIESEVASGHGRSLGQIAATLPPARRGKAVTSSCLTRWILNGVRTPDGGRVRLEAIRLAGRWVTTPQALERFLAAQQGRAPAPAQLVTGRASARRQRESERASEVLASSYGI